MPSTRTWIVDGRDFLAYAPDPAIPPAFAVLLSESEQARLQRFLQPRRAREFLLGRLLLRHALVQTLGCTPTDISIQERPGASPQAAIAGRLADGIALPGFSISHSRGWLACAIGEVFPVGVDIEATAPQRDLPALARQAFSESETTWLARQERHDDAFYRLWCAKEALYKFRHNAGLASAQSLAELDCGLGGAADAPGAADAFLHHEIGEDYHLCLCSGMPMKTHAIERLDCSLLLNLSGG